MIRIGGMGGDRWRKGVTEGKREGGVPGGGREGYPLAHRPVGAVGRGHNACTHTHTHTHLKVRSGHTHTHTHIHTQTHARLPTGLLH